jgi:integrase
MASIVQYPNTKFLVASFYDANGKLRRCSTHQTDRKRAQATADLYEKTAKRAGSLPKIRQAWEAFVKEFYGEEIPSANVRKYMLDWLDSRKAEVTVFTHNHYRKAVTNFLAFIGDAADKNLDMITRQQIAAFRDSRAVEVSAITANYDLQIVRAVFLRARIDGFIIRDPAEGVKNAPNRNPRKARPFTQSELRAILSIANPEWQSLIRFGVYTGQRLGDLASLTWDQLDLENGVIRLIDQKTSGSPAIRIGTALREHILSLPAGDQPGAPIHPYAFGLAARSKDGCYLSDQFRTIVIKAGLREPRPRKKRGAPPSEKTRGGGKKNRGSLTFHSLRHTHVSMAKAAGAPQSVAMEFVGHKSAAVSDIYTHTGDDALQRLADSFPKI